jgi:hypothetical protein
MYTMVYYVLMVGYQGGIEPDQTGVWVCSQVVPRRGQVPLLLQCHLGCSPHPRAVLLMFHQGRESQLSFCRVRLHSVRLLLSV